MLYLGSDHAGFKIKEELKKYFDQKKIKYQDLGNTEYDPRDDYPDYGLKVAKKVARSQGKDKGILLCGNAQGICITANKVKGVRAVTGYSVYAAKSSRQDDDANILCLAGRALKPAEVKKIVKAWLETKFSGAVRHKRRLKRLAEIEKKIK